MQQSSITCEDYINNTDNTKLLFLWQVLVRVILPFVSYMTFFYEIKFEFKIPCITETELLLKGAFQFRLIRGISTYVYANVYVVLHYYMYGSCKQLS